MEAGRLRHRVTIQSPTSEHDAAYGAELAPAWTDVQTVNASIDDLSQATIRVQEIARTFAGTTTHIVRMRYNANAKPNRRIRFKDRSFYINGVTNTQERNIETVCFCTEVTSPEVSQ